LQKAARAVKKASKQERTARLHPSVLISSSDQLHHTYGHQGPSEGAHAAKQKGKIGGAEKAQAAMHRAYVTGPASAPLIEHKDSSATVATVMVIADFTKVLALGDLS